VANRDNKKVQLGQATVARLLRVATKAFAEQGYETTTTAQIIAEVGVTKGALYHHFASKRDLFEAVYRHVEEQMGQQIQSASATTTDPWQQLTAGCHAYLEVSQGNAWQRILRIDGPSVLGYQRWAAIDQEFGLARLLPFLEHLAATGVIQVPSVEAFARLLTGAMNEATFWVAQHHNPGQALADSKASLDALLLGIKVG